MSGLKISADGLASAVSLSSRRLVQVYDEFQAMFPAARDVEMQDIYVRRSDDDAPGTAESVCVFYDSGACHEKLNPFFAGKTRPVRGGVLAVRSRVTSPKKCDDVLIPDRPLSEDEFVEHAQTFEADLAGFVDRATGSRFELEYNLFPDIRRAWSKDGSRWFIVNGVDLRRGVVRSGSLPPLVGIYDMDLLTFRYKWRSFTPSCILVGSRNFKRAWIEEYRFEFCVSCSRAVTAMCSGCGARYCCFSSRCVKESWKIHRRDCKGSARRFVRSDSPVSPGPSSADHHVSAEDAGNTKIHKQQQQRQRRRPAGCPAPVDPTDTPSSKIRCAGGPSASPSTERASTVGSCPCGSCSECACPSASGSGPRRR